jgi:hypothetical protein
MLLPTLFYVLCLLVMMQGEPDPLLSWLAWAFVATRYLHAFIHVTGNDVVRRFYAFLAGFLILAVMWLRFAWPWLAAVV